jgi:hypothetical protein
MSPSTSALRTTAQLVAWLFAASCTTLFIIAPVITLAVTAPRRPYLRELIAILDVFAVAPMSESAVAGTHVRQAVDVRLGVHAFRAARDKCNGCWLSTASHRPVAKNVEGGLNEVVRRYAAEARDAFLPLMLDKVHYRALATELGESTPRLLFNTSNSRCDHLPRMAALPPDFALKARHAAGCTLIVRGGVIITHKSCNGGREWVRSLLAEPSSPLSTFVSDRYRGRQASDAIIHDVCESFSAQLYLWSLSEWGYSQLTTGIVIEELLDGPEPSEASAAEDLKCFSFHGTTEYILHVANRFIDGGKRDTVFARDGSLLPVTVQGSSRLADPRESVFHRYPGLLADLLRRCDRAARGLAHLRVDYLLVHPRTPSTTAGASFPNGLTTRGRQHEADGAAPHTPELLLGELTPYPGGGAFHWDPPDFDHRMGAAYRGTTPPFSAPPNRASSSTQARSGRPPPRGTRAKK